MTGQIPHLAGRRRGTLFHGSLSSHIRVHPCPNIFLPIRIHPSLPPQ